MAEHPDISTHPRVVVAAYRAPRHRSNGVRLLSVFFALIAAFTVFLLAAGILYYQYLTVREPTCSVWVMGNSTLEGATISVSSLTLEAPLVDTLRPASRFSARFFMNPGNYRVTITDKDGKTLVDDNIDLFPSFPFGIDLNRLKPATRPS